MEPLTPYQFRLILAPQRILPVTPSLDSALFFLLYVEPKDDCLWTLALPERHSASYKQVSITGPVEVAILLDQPAAVLACMGFSRRTCQQFDRIIDNAARYHSQFQQMDRTRLISVEPVY